MGGPTIGFFPEEPLPAVSASLLADAVEVFGSTQIEGSIIDGAAGQRALTQFVAGQKLIGFARLHHESDTLLVLEINPTVGEHR